MGPPAIPAPHRYQGSTTQRDQKTADELLSEQQMLNALDAWNHVFLQSFLAMVDPVRQVRIENNDLESQWNRLARMSKPYSQHT
jgi:hypothetical protein